MLAHGKFYVCFSKNEAADGIQGLFLLRDGHDIANYVAPNACRGQTFPKCSTLSPTSGHCTLEIPEAPSVRLPDQGLLRCVTGHGEGGLGLLTAHTTQA